MTHQFSTLNIKPVVNDYVGEKIQMRRLVKEEITVIAYHMRDSKKEPGTQYAAVQIKLGQELRVVFISSNPLISQLDQVPKNKFPFTTVIRNDNNHYEFT